MAGCADEIDVAVPQDLLADDAEADRGPIDLGLVDTGPEDLGPPDLGPPDLGPIDPGPPDLGPIDPGIPDPGPPDPGPPDLGPQPDLGPELSETAAACVYVVENICAKVLPKCDFLGLIPASWMTTCTDFLVNNNGVIAGGCNTLDTVNTTDPNILLIQQMGPLLLEQCVDNFVCTLETATKLGTVVMPIIGGAKVDTGDIINLVAGLCFK